MFISSVNSKYQYNVLAKPVTQNAMPINVERKDSAEEKSSVRVPVGLNSLCNISFGLRANSVRLAGDVDIESYRVMSGDTKERYRKLYDEFSQNEYVDQSQLFDKTSKKLPLKSDVTMENFLKASQIYLKYKDNPIVCLGRSPKWFLNAAYWMQDGVPDYKFVAFSSYWFCKCPDGSLRRLPRIAPTEEEEQAYRKYLDRVGVNPQKIVETMKEEGKKTVITDYICSGKGACSFLDVLSRYAEDEGILEEFSKSIEIVGIGSMDYMEMLNPLADTISTPHVPLPPLLEPYGENIDQTFYDIDYNVFEEMLLSRNTNECRSTYYPPSAWTVYSPDVFKTGLINDMSKVRKLLEIFKDEKYVITFSAPMQDYRNLLNFRILDYLDFKNMLRKEN